MQGWQREAEVCAVQKLIRSDTTLTSEIAASDVVMAGDRARHVKQKRVELQGVRPVGGRPPARGKALGLEHDGPLDRFLVGE
jgi:hypothetical protein